MVFLRSEDHLTRWLDANSWQAGATVDAVRMNELARAWWWSRLDPAWRPRTVEESQAILDTVGLTGEFWALRK
jgi:hypothetical protein